jgi:rhodanese-related sulfurtransferase
LKVLGLTELSILNGGLEAWEAAQLPQDAAPVEVQASTFVPALDRSLIASRDDVRALIASKQARLVDARPADFFRGHQRHPVAVVPGTAPAGAGGSSLTQRAPMAQQRIKAAGPGRFSARLTTRTPWRARRGRGEDAFVSGMAFLGFSGEYGLGEP